MKFCILWFTAGILFVHFSKGCSGMETNVNMSHRNIMAVPKSKSASAIELFPYQNVMTNTNIYTSVAIGSLTLLIIFSRSQKHNRRRMKNKVLMNKYKSAGDPLESLEHLRAVFDATAVGVIAIDQERMVSYMNAMAAQMCGVRPETAIGQPVATIVRLVRGSRRSDVISRLHNFRAKFFTPDYSTYILNGHDKRSIHVQPIISPVSVRGKATGTVLLLKDVSASLKLMKKLVHIASHDRLTGLPNRSSFETYLQDAVNNLFGHKSKHALVFLDLDGFKAVNDSVGHAAGDALLKEIAHLLQMQLRHSDFLARLAGDEFALILFDCELAHAKCLMDIVVDNIRQYTFSWGDKKLSVGASAGIVGIDCAGASISELLARADAACYDAKRRGKGQARIYKLT